MCRLGCVSARLETSQHLPWICCDQNCCFPASRQLSELPWGGAWHRCGGPGGQLWALLGLCRLSLLFPAARCDVCSGSEWLVVALHGQLLRCKGAFSTLLLEFRPGALRFPPHGEPSSSSVGSAVGNSGEGGGESSVPCRVSAPQNAGSFGPSWQHLCMQCIRARSSLRH